MPAAFSCTTEGVTVTVTPLYLDEQSDPEQSHYVWAYNVQIMNESTEVLQLLNRYWNITDANGHVQEVRGPGVVGEQPVLRPGDSYEYTSGTYLATSSGIMRGSYEMSTLDGRRMQVEIPAFSLDSPDQIAKPN